MATRKQRAEKLAKRREEQKRHRRIRIEDHGRHKIEVPAGPKPTKSYHRTDPYKHGEALRQAEQIVTFCDRIDFKPTEAEIEMLRDLMREGRLTEKAVMAISHPEVGEEEWAELEAAEPRASSRCSPTPASLSASAKIRRSGPRG